MAGPDADDVTGTEGKAPGVSICGAGPGQDAGGLCGKNGAKGFSNSGGGECGSQAGGIFEDDGTVGVAELLNEVGAGSLTAVGEDCGGGGEFEGGGAEGAAVKIATFAEGAGEAEAFCEAFHLRIANSGSGGDGGLTDGMAAFGGGGEDEGGEDRS